MNINFSLVRFFDGIFHIVRKNEIKRKKLTISAKYSDGIYYMCSILLQSGDEEYLKQAKNQLNGKLLVNLNHSYLNEQINLTNVENLPIYYLELQEDQELTYQNKYNLKAISSKENFVLYENPQLTALDTAVFTDSSEIEESICNDIALENAVFTDSIGIEGSSCSDTAQEVINDKNGINLENITNSEQSKRNLLEISHNERPVGTALKNALFKKVERSRTKKYACLLCKKFLAKLPRHIETVHKDSEEAKKLLLIPKVSRQKNKKLSIQARARLDILDPLRKKGNFKHNVRASVEDVYITSRQPFKNKLTKTVDDYRVCGNCKETYCKESIRKHFKKCTGLSSKHNRHITSLHNEVVGNWHEKTNKFLKPILSRLKNDDISITIRYDELIIIHGNLQAQKFRQQPHHGKQIRAELRRLGRLLVELRKANKNITSFNTLYHPNNFTSFLLAVNTLGNFNQETDLYDTPATAAALGTLTKVVGEEWIAECIEQQFSEKRQEAEDFLHLYNVRFGKIINKTVSESQTQMQIQKKIQLPSLSDIKKLHNYLNEKRSEALKKLKIHFDLNVWKELVETTLASIQLLNRRRPGEIERLKLTHYKSLERIDEKTNPDLFKNLGVESKTLAAKYVRILLRGKLNRIVPILLNKEMHQSCETILKYRKEANVTNSPYVFALPSSGKHLKWASACDLLRKYSFECKADFPSTLRGTLLRKHIATACMALNLSNGEVDDLSKFLGHDKSIHLNIYRQPVATNDILHVSLLLEKAQGIYTKSKEEVQEFVEETDSEDENSAKNNTDTIDHDDVSTTSLIGNYGFERRSSTSNKAVEYLTPMKRSKWDEVSCEAVMKAFEHHIRRGSHPNRREIQTLIDSTPCLKEKRRTVALVRSWLQAKTNQILGRRSSPGSSVRKNRIPNSIYRVFADYIDQEIIPSIEDCSKVYEQSPSLAKFSPVNIQDYVKKAIDLSK